MIVFVDGFQSCGKTTLISRCKHISNRFPFNQYLDLFELEDLKGFQIAKDLGIMFGLQYAKADIVLDRGPLSTIFYSLKERRYGDKTEETMMKFLKEVASFKGFRYVFLKKKNAKPSGPRMHGDGFDYMNDDGDAEKDEILAAIVSDAKRFGMRVEVFENDFSSSIESNSRRFNDMIERLMDEHD